MPPAVGRWRCWMPNTPTPGEVAYEAYFALLYGGEPHLHPPG